MAQQVRFSLLRRSMATAFYLHSTNFYTPFYAPSDIVN